MSLNDRTNGEIELSQHGGIDGMKHGYLYVDTDSDSSFTPSSWVGIHFTDDEHDSDRIKMTYEEAGLLHDRLGLILGRPRGRRHYGTDFGGRSRLERGPYAPGPSFPPAQGGVTADLGPSLPERARIAAIHALRQRPLAA